VPLVLGHRLLVPNAFRKCMKKSKEIIEKGREKKEKSREEEKKKDKD
jgi:hypothetical protein